MEYPLVDIGVNLSNKAFDGDREEVVERAIASGVSTMILTGTDINESLQVLELAKHFDSCCFSTAGIHPHDAKSFTRDDYSTLKDMLNEDKVVAVGETGLDFNRDFSPRPVQESVFEQQIELAIEYNLPLFCHERDASQRFSKSSKPIGIKSTSWLYTASLRIKPHFTAIWTWIFILVLQAGYVMNGEALICTHYSAIFLPIG